MENARSSLFGILGIAVLLLVVISLTWVNYRFVLQNPGGNDFLPRWLGTRLYLMEGQSPYSEETTREIQRMIFGRQARQDEDQSLFVYPFYTIFVVAPFAIVGDFPAARALWMTVLEIGVLLLGGASLYLSRWQSSRFLLMIVLVFIALWYHSVRPVINGNVAVIVALLTAGAFLAIRSEQDVLAGFLLALSTIKPQMVVLLIPFVLIWGISQRRWTLFWGFVGCLALLVASTSLLMPNWIVQNMRQVLAYPDYTLPGTPGAIFAEWLPGVGNQMGWTLSILLVGVLLWEWRAALGKEFRWFFWTSCLTLVITNLVGIRTTTANYIALLPALILVFATWEQSWGALGRWLVVISMFLLFFGLWWLFLATIQQGDQPVQHSVMFFPLPIFLLFGLYWIRWWIVRPLRPWLDRLRRSRNGGFIIQRF